MGDTIDSVIYPNGLHVIHQQSLHDLPICSIYLFCDVGSAFETDELRGIAHFLEHMLFQGTKTKTHKDIFQEYDRIGNQFNAVTTKRFTCFYVKCHENHGERVLHLLTDIMQNSKLNEKAMESEQKVIERELKTKQSQFDITAHSFFENAVYKHSSFEYPIDDFSYRRDPISQETLKRWYEWFYQPHNIVLSIVSTKSLSYWKHKLRDTNLSKNGFREKKVQKPKTALFAPVRVPFQPTKPDNIDITIDRDLKAKNTFMVLGFRTVDQYSDKKYALELVTHILNGMSGRLFDIFRQKHGLVYSIVAESGEEEFEGFFAISAELDGKYLKKVFELIYIMFIDLIQNGIKDEEFDIGKQRLKGSHHIQYEDINTFARHNGLQQMLFIRDRENVSNGSSKSILPFEKLWNDVYEKITKTYLHDIIKELFIYSNIVVSIVTPLDIHLEEIREWSKKYKP
jgi:predicted Zn-dependent peptidase